MAKLNIDARVIELLGRAKANPDAAAGLLLIAAEYMRAGKPLPEDLAEHLASSFEAAMNLSPEKRGPALLRKLQITAGNRRPVDVDWFVLGKRFDELIGSGESINGTASQISVEFSIDESTAIRIWRGTYLPARAAHRDALKDADEAESSESIDPNLLP